MTRAELRAAIKEEGRIKSATNLDLYVNNLMDEILRDHCNKTRYHELLSLDYPLTMIAGQSSYFLPPDYQNLSDVRFGQTAALQYFTTTTIAGSWDNTNTGTTGKVTRTTGTWTTAYNGQRLTLSGITTGGIDGSGTFLFLWLTSTTATVTIDGVTPVALPSTGSGTITIRVTTQNPIASYRSLTDMSQVVRKTFPAGVPLYYQLVTGNKIALFPYGDIQINDQLLMDYYIDPTIFLFAADADRFPIARLQSVVLKEAVSRVQRFSSSMKEASMMSEDANASFNAAHSAS